jgi:hypothetical protein
MEKSIATKKTCREDAVKRRKQTYNLVQVMLRHRCGRSRCATTRRRACAIHYRALEIGSILARADACAPGHGTR